MEGKHNIFTLGVQEKNAYSKQTFLLTWAKFHKATYQNICIGLRTNTWWGCRRTSGRGLNATQLGKARIRLPAIQTLLPKTLRCNFMTLPTAAFYTYMYTSSHYFLPPGISTTVLHLMFKRRTFRKQHMYFLGILVTISQSCLHGLSTFLLTRKRLPA